MKPRACIWPFLTVLVMVVLAGCATTAVRNEATRVVINKEAGLRAVALQPEPEFERIDSAAFNLYIDGLLFEESRDLVRASESFRLAWARCPESVEIGLAYARSLAMLRDYPKALEAIDRLKQVTADGLALKAMCFRRLGDPSRAREAYLELVAVDTTSDVAYMFLASYYQQTNDLDSTVWALTRLARVIPDSHEVQNELGKAYTAKGDIAGARSAFRRSLELTPAGSNNMEALMRLAESYEAGEQIDTVRSLLEETLEKDPNNVVLHRELAQLWLAQDSASRALPHMWAVALLTPNDWVAHRRLAITLMASDSMTVADSILSALVAAGDTDPTNHFYLGRIAIISRDFERARDEMTTVTRVAGGVPDAWLALGFAYRQLGQTEQEIETYQAGLLQMREEEPAIQLYFALGAAFEFHDQVDSAVAVFEEILRHNPNHAQSLNYLGYTLADRNIRLDYARELLEQAVRLQPDNAAYLDSYGWVHYRLGEFDKAVKYLEAAAELDSDPVIYDHFGDALDASGQTERAREWWQRALEQQPDNETIREKLSR